MEEGQYFLFNTRIMYRQSLLVGLSLAALQVYSSEKRPNVIVIYTDDHGTLDMNCFGAPDLCTPNMDSIAANGVKFTQFYGAPVSSASRASLMTGQFTLHSGVTGNCGWTGLKPEKQTIAEKMRDNGYRTACIGKWHLGSWPEYRPTNQGFEYFWGFLGGCIDSYSHFYYWGGPNMHDLWRNNTEIHEEGKFFAEETLHETERFILEGNQEQPFFVYWAVNIPHYPLQPKKKWLDYYAALPTPRRMYAAFVSTFDDYLGDLTTFLRAHKMLENTIIILQSDNGHSTEVRTFGGGGYCGNYRGAKFSLFEGGIRVPAIISWKGHIPEGETRRQLASNVDWYPTIMDYCGIDCSADDIDGHSLRQVIADDKTPTPHDVIHFDFNNQWAVRQDEWKLICNAIDVKPNDKNTTIQGLFLSNLAIDSTESVNLAEKYPEKVKQLQQLRNEYTSKLNKK
jgi:arylsulfatase A